MKEKPQLEVILETEVRDKNGKLISIHRQPARSLLKNFAVMLRTMLSAYYIAGGSYSITATLKDITGADTAFYGAYSAQTGYIGLVPFFANAPAGVINCGIVVGNNSTPVSRNDFKLISQILHGSDVGQLSYGSMTVEETNGVAPDTIFRLIRTFTNNTSDIITVAEIGLYVGNNRIYNSTPNVAYFCIARDVLSPSQTVPAGATLTVRYIFKVTA